MAALKHIPSSTIKSILGNHTQDKYRDCENELAQVLWERQDKQLDAQMDSMANDIDKEFRRFKKQSEAFQRRLEIDGDSQELRDDIMQCIKDFNAFSEFCL